MSLNAAFRAAVGAIRIAVLPSSDMQRGTENVIRGCEGADEKYGGGGEGH